MHLPRQFFIVALAATSTNAATLFMESFNDISTLPADGWVQINASSPLGATDWFQGNAGIFPAHSGAPSSYIAANFENAAPGGMIANWLISPELTFTNRDVISFWTRTVLNPTVAPDRLRLQLSDAGASIDFSDFETVLEVNPNLTSTDYPNIWTRFTYTVDGLLSATSGRFALVYAVPNTSVNGDYIGIDDVSFTEIPEPVSVLTLGIGLAVVLGFQALRRWRNGRWCAPFVIGLTALLIATGSATAEDAKPDNKTKPFESVKVVVRQKTGVPGGVKRQGVSEARVLVREGSELSARSIASGSRQQSDAVVTKLPNGGTAARLGPSYLSMVTATRNRDGSIKVSHQSEGEKKTARTRVAKGRSHAR